MVGCVSSRLDRILRRSVASIKRGHPYFLAAAEVSFRSRSQQHTYTLSVVDPPNRSTPPPPHATGMVAATLQPPDMPRRPGRGSGSGQARRRRAAAAASVIVPSLFLLLALLLSAARGFHPPARATPSSAALVAGRRGRLGVVGPRWFNPRASEEEQQQQAPSKSTSTMLPPAAPASASSSPQYEELMEKLTDDEKYNILLQSRASSLIDLLGGRGGGGSKSSGGSPGAEFEPLYRLLEEMTAKGVKLTSKSFATLMDAASLSRSLAVIQACLVQARRNGVCRAFSRDVGVLAMPPSSMAGAAAAAATDSLPPVPTDERSLEVSAGLGALAVVGGALGYEALAPLFHADTTAASVLLLLVGVAAALDFTQRQGQELRLILAGLNRLFMRDPEREARVQAATFLSAYLLGLPCFCFSPSVLEAARLPVEVDDFRDALGSTTGLNRLLVYLLAPVAAEEANHVQLVASDPRQARALVQLFRERNPEVEVDGEGVVLPWAFQEAKRLLQANAGLLEKLRKRMESGGATVGDIVSLIEGGEGAARGGRGGS